MLARLDGLFVSSPKARDYSFVPEGEDDRREGTTRRVWVFQTISEAPVQVNFDDDHADSFEKCRAMGTFGGTVAWLVEMSGRSCKFREFADESTPVGPAPARAAR